MNERDPRPSEIVDGAVQIPDGFCGGETVVLRRRFTNAKASGYASRAITVHPMKEPTVYGTTSGRATWVSVCQNSAVLSEPSNSSISLARKSPGSWALVITAPSIVVNA